MGQSPLKLVIGRVWHDLHSFTDKLECGHVSRLQFTDFTWEAGKLVNLEPTAKHRRCQKCAAILREATSGVNPVSAFAHGQSTAVVAPTVKEQSAQGARGLGWEPNRETLRPTRFAQTEKAVGREVVASAAPLGSLDGETAAFVTRGAGVASQREGQKNDTTTRIGVQPSTSGQATGGDPTTPGLFNLYADCLAETSLPSPKKPCQSERDPNRGKKVA